MLPAESMVGLYFAKKRGTPALTSHTRILPDLHHFALVFKVGSVWAELREAGTLARGAPW